MSSPRHGHLVLHFADGATIDAWQSVGVAFVSLGEGIDATSAAGRLQLHVLAALAGMYS